jgi:hypothetical protein
LQHEKADGKGATGWIAQADPVRAVESYSNEDIAAQLGWSPTTVERKRRLIWDAWAKEVTP